jgi:3-keto-5-aminohexanoate cleavage enzyme
MDKLIITTAITGMGIVTSDMSPYMPKTVDEVAEEVFRSYEAGSASVHLHAIDPTTGGRAPEPNLVIKEYIKAIRERCDVLINVTTGGGRRVTPAQEAEGLTVDDIIHEKIQLGEDLCSLNMASTNPWRYPPPSDRSMQNPTSRLEKWATWMKEAGVKPEMEVWTPNDVMVGAIMHQRGILEEPLYYQLCMTGMAGIPPTARALQYCIDSIPKEVKSVVSAFGIGRNEIPVAALATVMGTHTRVGFDDNIYLSYKVLAKSNAELVTKVVGIAKAVGREIATVDDAREMLGIRRNP